MDTRRIVLNRQSIEARHAYLQAQHAYLEAVSPDRHRSAAELMGCAQVVLTRLMFYEDRLRTLLRHLRSSAPTEVQNEEGKRAELELFIVSREQGAFADLIAMHKDMAQGARRRQVRFDLCRNVRCTNRRSF